MSGKVFVLLLLFVVLDTGVANEENDRTCVSKTLTGDGSNTSVLLPYARKVTSMNIPTVDLFAPYRPCTYDETYGFGDSTVWVAGGCRGHFEICYKLGSHPLIVCIMEGEEDEHKCELRSKRKIIRIEFVQYEMNSKECIEHETYGFADDYVWTKHGCRAAFRVTIPYKNEGNV